MAMDSRHAGIQEIPPAYATDSGKPAVGLLPGVMAEQL